MKVAIIGLGFRLGYRAHVFRELDPDFEIVEYRDLAPAGLPRLQEYGIEPGIDLASAQELIRAGGYDLLMIGSPNHLHLDQIRAGLEAGNRVFSEKPIVSTIEQTNQLAVLWGKSGPENLMVGLVLPYSPLYRDLIAARNDGMLVILYRSKPPSISTLITVRFSCATGGVMKNGRAGSCWKNAAMIRICTIANPRVGMNFHINLNAPDQFRRFAVFGTKGQAEGDFIRAIFKVTDVASETAKNDKTFQA